MTILFDATSYVHANPAFGRGLEAPAPVTATCPMTGRPLVLDARGHWRSPRPGELDAPAVEPKPALPAARPYPRHYPQFTDARDVAVADTLWRLSYHPAAVADAVAWIRAGLAPAACMSIDDSDLPVIEALVAEFEPESDEAWHARMALFGPDARDFYVEGEARRRAARTLSRGLDSAKATK